MKSNQRTPPKHGQHGFGEGKAVEQLLTWGGGEGAGE